VFNHKVRYLIPFYFLIIARNKLLNWNFNIILFICRNWKMWKNKQLTQGLDQVKQGKKEEKKARPSPFELTAQTWAQHLLNPLCGPVPFASTRGLARAYFKSAYPPFFLSTPSTYSVLQPACLRLSIEPSQPLSRLFSVLSFPFFISNSEGQPIISCPDFLSFINLVTCMARDI